MSKITDYMAACKARLATDPLVAQFAILKERSDLAEGYFRARVTLYNGDLLDAAEYLELRGGSVITVSYRFQWMTANRTLRIRWDDTPHHPALANFPHHIHEGDEAIVTPSKPMTFLAVLDEIAERLAGEQDSPCKK
jgi:hypothetical protein